MENSYGTIISKFWYTVVRYGIFSLPRQSPVRATPGVGGGSVSKMLKFLRESFLCDGQGAVRQAILSL